MGRHKGVHEGLEVGAPPLRKAVADLPVTRLLAVAKTSDGSQPLVQARLESLNLVVLGLQVVARKLEKRVCDLKHEDVRVVMFMTN